MINKSIVWIYIFALLILCLSFTSFRVSAQEPDHSFQDTANQITFKSFGINRQSQLRNSIEEYKKSNEELPGEKIYLHTDRKTVLKVIVNGIEIGTGNPGQKYVEINHE